MKSSGAAVVSGHRRINMTIQADLPASRCVSRWAEFVCVYKRFYCPIECLQRRISLSSSQHFVFNSFNKKSFNKSVVFFPNVLFDAIKNSLMCFTVSPSRLPSTTGSSDRTRPGSGVCVGVCRAWPGHQRSQRLVYCPCLPSLSLSLRKEKKAQATV